MSYGKMSESDLLMNLLEMDEWEMPEVTDDYDFDTPLNHVGITSCQLLHFAR